MSGVDMRGESRTGTRPTKSVGYRKKWDADMGDSTQGEFSLGLMSLQLQLKTLLEGAGGEHAAALLDAVSEFDAAEQRVLLGVLERVLRRVASGSVRLPHSGSAEEQMFEDSLYSDLLEAFQKAAGDGKIKLELVHGGCGTSRHKTRRIIYLDEERQARDDKPVVR